MTDTILDMTAKIVSAHVTRNHTSPETLPDLIRSVFGALSSAGTPSPNAALKEPAVPLKKSVFSDHLICLECGGSFKILKGHLRADHDLNLEQYRERFRLPEDYPTVAPEYAGLRSRMAKKSGLGRSLDAKTRID